jgi:hypothetical protein
VRIVFQRLLVVAKGFQLVVNFGDWFFGRDPICNLIAGVGGEINKSDASALFRFR